MIQRAMHGLAIHFAGFNKKAKTFLNDAAQAILFIGGLCAIAFGAWMIYRPLGFIVGGIFAVRMAFLLASD